MLSKIFGHNKAKQGIAWLLYDFANSIVIVVFFLYFSQWLVVDRGVPDIWYNLIFTGSSILLILTSPILGIISDKKQQRMPLLRFSTVLMFVCLAVVSLLALFGSLSAKITYAIVGFYLLASYFYQLSFSFYNPLLDEVAPQEKRGLISGLGQSANWLGSIFGLGVSLPLITGAIYLFGNSGRPQTFLPATILFFLLALPSLIILKDPNPVKIKINIFSEYKTYFASLKEMFRIPGVGRYLLAFFFFNDALLTVQNNFPIYLEQVFNVSDKIKSILLGSTLVFSVIGAFLGGFIADKLGHKKTLLIILTSWLVVFPLLGTIKIFPIFCALTVCLGFLYGATWSVTRAVMVDLTPKQNLNHAFSYYTLAERFATFVGPVTWGLITSLLIHRGPVRYQFAFVSMTIFVAIGLYIVRKIPNDKKTAPVVV